MCLSGIGVRVVEVCCFVVALVVDFYISLRTRGGTSGFGRRTRDDFRGGSCAGTHCLCVRTCGSCTGRKGVARTVRYNARTTSLCRHRGCCRRTFSLYQRVDRVITGRRRTRRGGLCNLHFKVAGRHLRVCVGLEGATRTRLRLGVLSGLTRRSNGPRLARRLLCAGASCFCVFRRGGRKSTTFGGLVDRCQRGGRCNGVSRYCRGLVTVTHGTGGVSLLRRACRGCVM